MKRRIEQEIDKSALVLQELDRKLAEREKILDLAKKAPTAKETRAAIAALFKEEDLDPIKEMIKMVKVSKGPNKLPPHQKAMILKELAQYQAAKPKSMDIQQDDEMNVSVGMIDFRSANQRAMSRTVAAEDEDYDEFMEGEDEA